MFGTIRSPYLAHKVLHIHTLTLTLRPNHMWYTADSVPSHCRVTADSNIFSVNVVDTNQ